jgi:hypothetical protein
MKRFFSLITVLVFSVLLVACGDTELDAPVVEINNGVLTWDAVEDADNYKVFIDTNAIETSDTTFDLNDENLAVGSYTIYVVAATSDSLSMPSNSVTFEVVDDGGGNEETLDAPANVAVSNEMVTWDAVTGATSYIIMVDSTSYSTTTLSFDLATLNLPVGSYSITVKAIAGSVESSNSLSVTFEVVALVNADEIFEAVLLIVDPTYVPNMTEDDFEEDMAYENYLDVSQMVELYADEANQLAMTTDDAVGFFDDMYTPMMEGNIETFSDMMDTFDAFDTYHMTNERVVELLYSFIEMAISLNKADLEAELVIDNQAYLDAQTEIETYKLSDEYLDVVGMLLDYAVTSEQTAAINVMVSDDQYGLLNAFNDMATTVYQYGEVTPSDYYWYVMSSKEMYVDELASVLIAINADDLDREFLNNTYPLFQVQMDLSMLYSELEMYDLSIVFIEDAISQIESVQSFMLSDNEQNKEALLTMIDFMMTIQSTIPDDVINLVDDMMEGTVLSPTEIFQIKDELINVIQEAMPTADEFSVLRLVQIAFASSISGSDLSGLEAQATYLGNLDHASLEVALLFAEDFDVADYTSLMLVLQPLMSESVDAKAVADVLDYVMTYIEDFEEAHPDEVQTLAALVGSTQVEAIYDMLFEEAIAMLEDQEYTDEESLYVLNTLANSYDEVMILLDMIKDIGMDAIDTFVETEGSLIDAFMLLNQGDFENQDDEIAAVIDAIEEADAYLELLAEDLSEEQYVALLSFARIPIVLGISYQLDMTLEEADEFVSSIYPVFGETGYALTEVVLLFIQDINEEDINQVLDIVMAMNEDPENALNAVADLIIFVSSYIDDFEAENPDEVAALLSALDSEDLEMIYDLVFVKLIDYVTNTQDLNIDKEVTLYVLNELAANYDAIISFRDLILSVGVDSLQTFVDSEAAIIDVVMDFESLNFEDGESGFIAFTALIDELTNYHDNVVGLMTEQQINDLLSLVRVAVVVDTYYSNDMEVELADLDALVDTLQPHVTSIILNVINLEQQLITQIDAIDYTIYYGETGYTMDPELAVMLMGIDMVDQLTSMSNTLKIYSISSTLFDDILENDDVQAITHMSSEDITMLKDGLESMIDAIIEDVSDLKALDFSNLSNEDIQLIKDVMISYGLINQSFEDMLMNAEVVELDQITYVEVDGDYEYFQFIAPSNGVFVIYSSGEYDPYLSVFNQEFIYVDGNDDAYAQDYNFSLEIELEMGDVIYLEIGQYDSGTFSFRISVPN